MTQHVIVGVPFYKNPHLVEPLVGSILKLAVDRSKYDLSFLFVIDSPSDAELVRTLTEACDAVRAVFPVELIVNEMNLGFVGSANVIIANARARNADLILINSDVVLFEDTVQEMLAAASFDPMIGFVSPRTNNTTICAFPLPKSDADETTDNYRAFRVLAPKLPQVTYTPTAVGFCLLIKSRILQDFSGFDPIFTPGYNEENDLILRANRCGYLAVIANRAFAYHEGGSSFDVVDHGTHRLEKRHSAVIAARHPHYYTAVSAYFESADHHSLALIAQLGLESRPVVAFDFSSFGMHKNGTTEYGTCVLRSFIKLFANRYKPVAICDEAAWRAQGLHELAELSWSPTESDEKYSVVFRPGQPFDLRSVTLPNSRAAVVIYSMLDTIAYDCLHLRDPQLHRFWQFVMEHSDAVFYISEFSRDQFLRRFASRPHVRHVVSMPSTEVEEYRSSHSELSSTHDDYLLVVGNHFAHKAVREVVYLMREHLPGYRLRVLGSRLPELPDLVTFESGELHESTVAELYARATAVVFPSHYEGFGFPVMHALANRKIIFVRDLPVYAEIRARISTPENIRVFQTNQDLLQQLAASDFAWTDQSQSNNDVGWDRAARELEAEISRALESTNAAAIKQRLENLRILELALDSAALAREHERVRARDLRELDEQRAQIRMLEESVARQTHGMAELREKMTSILSSTSWRITSPMRRLKTTIIGGGDLK
jgi:GT2 family glycosyltransferase